jgi:hypothetical protein
MRRSSSARTMEIVRAVASLLVLSSCSAGIDLPEPFLIRTSVGLEVSHLWTRASAVVVGDLTDVRRERGRVSDLYPCTARIHVKETFKGAAPPEGAKVLWYSAAPECSRFGALATPPGLPPGAWESIYFLRSEAGWLRPIVDDRGSVAFVTGIRSGQGPGASILADALADGQVFAEDHLYNEIEKCWEVCAILDGTSRQCAPSKCAVPGRR